MVLRVDQTGGFTMQGYQYARRPMFTLYGDGRIVYRLVDTEGGPMGTAFPALQEARMSEEQVQALLRLALGQGRLLDARPQYRNDAGAGDIPSAFFTLQAGGLSKTVEVQAMGADPVPPGDAADVRALMGLYEFLNDFAKQVDAGQATVVGPYLAPSYQALLFPAEGQPGAKPWPWPEVTAGDLVKGEFDQVFLELTPEQVAKVADVPNGGLIGFGVIGPDKKSYQVAIRPNLPDDVPAGQAPSPSPGG